ncbi:MAG: hypothetical protein N2C12_08910 [Planctomycetales bacterium]
MKSEGSTKTQAIFPRPSMQAPDVSIQWTYWPRRTPAEWAVVSASILAVFVWVFLVTGKLHLGTLAAIASALALWKIYFPVTYRIDRKGIRKSVLGCNWKLPWTEIVGMRIVADGLQLQQRHAKTGLIQGSIFIPWGQHEKEVRECLLKLVPQFFDSHSNKP